MYRVRGADQNVYGPIAAETVRQWIAERRLNRDSQVCREGEEVWQPLGQVAEFAEALGGGGGLGMASPGAAVPALPAGVHQGAGVSDSREAALAEAKPAAISMIVFGAVSLLVALLSLLQLVVKAAQGGNQAQEIPPETPEIFRKMAEWQMNTPPVVQWVTISLSILMSAIVIFGGVKFLSLKSRALVMTGAILAILTCFTTCCCGLGVGLGIWVLILINKPGIRNQFD